MALLERAVTHRSFSADHNERLEFLGDAILQWIVTDLIFEAHPSLNEGALTDLRKSLVNAETLANIAVEIPEAPHGGTLYRILFLAAVLLFVFTFLINTVAEVVRQRLRTKYSQY